MDSELAGKAIAEALTGPHWRINKNLATYIGLENALFFTHLLDHFRKYSKEKRLDKEGYFYLVQGKIEKRTSLSMVQQTLIIKKLTGQEPIDSKTKKTVRLIDVKKKGLPARNWYRILFQELIEIFAMDLDQEDDENLNSSSCSNLGSSSCSNLGTSSYSNLGTSDPVEIGTKDNNNEGNNNEGNKSPSKEGEYVPAGQSPLLDDPSDQNPIENEQPVLRRRKDASGSKKVPYVSPNVAKVLEVWNGSGLRRHQNVESKVYASMVYSIKKLLRRDYFKNHLVFNGYKDKRFTVEEINQAIRNFALAALNPDYEPTGGYKEHLSKMSFPDFLYNAFAEDDSKSMFITYFEHPPKLVRDNLPMPKDEHPEYTKCMKDFYARKVKGGLGRLNGKQERKFVLAGQRIHDFFLENKKRIIPMFVKRVDDRVELVFDAVNEFYKEQGIQPGNFCSDYTFDHILPIYLERQAVLED